MNRGSPQSAVVEGCCFAAPVVRSTGVLGGSRTGQLCGTPSNPATLILPARVEVDLRKPPAPAGKKRFPEPRTRPSQRRDNSSLTPSYWGKSVRARKSVNDRYLSLGERECDGQDGHHRFAPWSFSQHTSEAGVDRLRSNTCWRKRRGLTESKSRRKQRWPTRIPSTATRHRLVAIEDQTAT